MRAEILRLKLEVSFFGVGRLLRVELGTNELVLVVVVTVVVLIVDVVVAALTVES